MNMLIAYDGSAEAEAALDYGLARLEEEDGGAVVLNLFNCAVFIESAAGPVTEEAALAEEARRMEELTARIAASGAAQMVRVEVREGEPVSEILDAAGQYKPDVIMAPAGYGSVRGETGAPVIFFPGSILVAVDDTGHARAALGRITAEARATLSRVVLLGLLPENMYGLSEREELARLETRTLASLKEMHKALRKEGIDTLEILRPGYPDEEILRAMEEFSASIVMVPMLDDEPSEIAKAAQIIREEAEGHPKPVMLFTAQPEK